MFSKWAGIHARGRRSLALNASWMLMGQGGNFLIQAAYFLLLARLLGVTEYGVFAGAFALVSSVTPYSSLGSPLVFMRHVSDDHESAQLYWGNILAITACVTFLIMVGLAIGGAKLFGEQRVGMILVLVVANCFMSQLVLSASTVFQTFERLKATAWLRTLSSLLRMLAIAALFMLLHKASAFQCSLAILVSSSVAAGVATVWVTRTVGGVRTSVSLFRQRFWEGVGFSVAGSTQAVYNDVDKMMLSHYNMNAANGIYTLAYRVVDFATAPVTAIDAAVLPRFFNLYQSGVSAIRRMSGKVIPIAAGAGLAAAVFTLLSAPTFVRIVGHGFAESLMAIRWLCWLPVLRGVHQLAGGVLTATGRQNYRTGAQFLVAALNISLNLIWIPSHGWLGAAWASLASDGALGVLNLLLMFFVLKAT